MQAATSGRLIRGSRSLPAVLVAVTVLLVAGGRSHASSASLPQPHPTAKDRSDARRYIAANRNARRKAKSLARALPALSEPVKACKIDATRTTTGFGSRLTLQIQLIAVMQHVAPLFEQYSRELNAVKAHDPSLRAFATWVARSELPLIRSFATQPPVDECAILNQWKATGYSRRFDLAAAAHLPARLARRSAQLVKNDAPLHPSDALATRVSARLVAFGISLTQAQAFVDQT